MVRCQTESNSSAQVWLTDRSAGRLEERHTCLWLEGAASRAGEERRHQTCPSQEEGGGDSDRRWERSCVIDSAETRKDFFFLFNSVCSSKARKGNPYNTITTTSPAYRSFPSLIHFSTQGRTSEGRPLTPCPPPPPSALSSPVVRPPVPLLQRPVSSTWAWR